MLCRSRLSLCLATILRLGMLLGTMVFTLEAQPLPVITNLAQLTQAANQNNGLTASLKLKATVFACSKNCDVLVLADESGAGLLELDGLNGDFQPGDRVEIDGAKCFLGASKAGVYVCAAPTLDNDRLHGARTVEGRYFFAAGRHPLRLDWFNQLADFQLSCSCVEVNSGVESPETTSLAETNLLHAVRAECFQGFWKQLPNFQLLQAVKSGSASNFDVGFRSRDNLVGIRFEGYFDAPRSGDYHFALRSDDGSRLWIGDPAVSVKKLGREAVPPAPLAMIGQTVSGLNQHWLATIEGHIGFVSGRGKGLDIELHSDQESVWITMTDAGDLKPEDLLNTYVRVSGVAGAVLTESERIVLGKLAVPSSRELTIIEGASTNGTVPPVLKSSLGVLSLSAKEAARHRAVALRGVVTAVGPGRSRWMVVQDDTHGVFIGSESITNSAPNIGELWEVRGHTEPGDFAPVIIAEHTSFIGKGRLPEPVRPDWNQLINGSMEVQWVEIRGLVTGVQSNRLSLLLPEGQLQARLPEWEHEELDSFKGSVIRVRGTLFVTWSPETHEIENRRVTIYNASFSVESPAPVDPFDAPEKSPRGLFHFDVKAMPFQRAKFRGQVTYADSKRLFLQHDAGIEVIPVASTGVRLGDWAEAVGYPEISGGSPRLRQALLRKVSDGILPDSKLLPNCDPTDSRLVGTRVHLEGVLAGQHAEGDAGILQIQTHSHLFLVRIADAVGGSGWQLGSKLSLAGIQSFGGQIGTSQNDISRFDMLVNGPDQVVVISKPLWWTLERLLVAMGILLVTLAVAVGWITLLKRQVAQRTLQLQHEIQERETAERERSLEAERARIARDLHDDLGASLTEIAILGSTGRRPETREQSAETLFQMITSKAKDLVASLDITVWALNPRDNSLQLVGDYLCDFARNYLSSFGITCRFDVPVTLPDATMEGRRRHELFLAVKETLNNVVRHANATEVEFRVAVTQDELEIVIADNGKGFIADPSCNGNGLRNLPLRLSKIGGSYEIESTPGNGTTVRIVLKFSREPARR